LTFSSCLDLAGEILLTILAELGISVRSAVAVYFLKTIKHSLFGRKSWEFITLLNNSWK